MIAKASSLFGFHYIISSIVMASWNAEAWNRIGVEIKKGGRELWLSLILLLQPVKGKNMNKRLPIFTLDSLRVILDALGENSIISQE